jgi:hypothetical protein
MYSNHLKFRKLKLILLLPCPLWYCGRGTLAIRANAATEIKFMMRRVMKHTLREYKMNQEILNYREKYIFLFAYIT